MGCAPMSKQETIHLNLVQLINLLHLAANTDLDDLERDDPAAFRVAEQIGLFFATNLEMADYAIDINEITLTPQLNKAPPLVALQVTYKRRTYHLETREDGRLPPLPFGTKKRRTKRWRKRKLNLTDGKG